MQTLLVLSSPKLILAQRSSRDSEYGQKNLLHCQWNDQKLMSLSEAKPPAWWSYWGLNGEGWLGQNMCHCPGMAPRQGTNLIARKRELTRQYFPNVGISGRSLPGTVAGWHYPRRFRWIYCNFMTTLSWKLCRILDSRAGISRPDLI